MLQYHDDRKESQERENGLKNFSLHFRHGFNKMNEFFL